MAGGANTGIMPAQDLPMPSLPPEFADTREDRIHPALTLLLVLAASGLGWAVIFAFLFLRTL